VPLWPTVFKTLKTAPPPANPSKSSLRGAQRRGNPHGALPTRRSNPKPHEKTINHREAQRKAKEVKVISGFLASGFLCVSLWLMVLSFSFM
jgi:hypothetical protein